MDIFMAFDGMYEGSSKSNQPEYVPTCIFAGLYFYFVAWPFILKNTKNYNQMLFPCKDIYFLKTRFTKENHQKSIKSLTNFIF